MKIHIFFVDFEKEEIGACRTGTFFEIKDKEIIHQIKNVLKLRVGEKIVFCDGKLNELVCELVEIKNGAIKARVFEARKNANEPAVKVVLYCSILKRENFEWAVQKAVEVGVSEIVPIICERTIKTGFKKERLEKIIKEAAEQSGRGILPVFGDVRELATIISDHKFRDIIFSDPRLSAPAGAASLSPQSGLREGLQKQYLGICFDASGESLGTTRSKLQVTKSQYSKIGIFIGPEGGWSDGELETFHALAQKNPDNFKIASLSKTTLRAETAAVVGVYSITNLLS